MKPIRTATRSDDVVFNEADQHTLYFNIIDR